MCSFCSREECESHTISEVQQQYDFTPSKSITPYHTALKKQLLKADDLPLAPPEMMLRDNYLQKALLQLGDSLLLLIHIHKDSGIVCEAMVYP